MNDFKKIKSIINRIEKKQKEFATCKAKLEKLENEIKELEKELQKLLNTSNSTIQKI